MVINYFVAKERIERKKPKKANFEYLIEDINASSKKFFKLNKNYFQKLKHFCLLIVCFELIFFINFLKVKDSISSGLLILAMISFLLTPVVAYVLLYQEQKDFLKLYQSFVLPETNKPQSYSKNRL